MSQFRLLIDGKLVDGDLTMDVVNPATEEVVAQCSRASRRQLDLAVAAAKAAFPSWSGLSVSDRRDRIADMADVGSGIIDWKKIFAQSGKAGIKHYFVEFDNPKAPFDSIASSYGYLETLRF